MAAVSVFVDDAIRGQLPDVCIKTGRPAELLVRSSHPAGGGSLGLLWLLVLLGPPGWLGLVLLSFMVPGQERLTVRLPYTEAAWDRARAERRCVGLFLLLTLAAAVLAVARIGPFPLLWPVLGATFLVAGCSLWALIWFRDTGVYLDGSRRWVTLTRVHADFARAADLQDAGIARR